MEAPITRPSNVAGMLLAGAYLYVDFPGAEAQAVEVTYVDGCPVCRFRDAEPGDEGLELDPRDMAGEFRAVLPPVNATSTPFPM